MSEPGLPPILARAAMDGAPAAARRLIDEEPLGAVEIDRPALEQLGYADLVRALPTRPGFRLDFRDQSPAEALAMLCRRLFGPDRFRREQALFAEDIASLAAFVGALAGGRPQVAIRTFFAPGDLVWHLDRMNGAGAYRLVWPIGRSAGMQLTPADNIDGAVWRAWMRREHALLGRLDTQVAHEGGDVERIWAHRPVQLAAMTRGAFPFVIDPRRIAQVRLGAASIHRVDTPGSSGTFHRSHWANRDNPGVQVLITAAVG